MKVDLIASTMMAVDYEKDTLITDLVSDYESAHFHSPEDISDADDLAEFAGRSCYQSFTRPNDKTAKNIDYLANILKQQHYSVLEHASATFYVQGVSRALTHELIRHRHLSYSQLSQRFTDKDLQMVIPPAIAALPSPDRDQAVGEYTDAFNRAALDYKHLEQVLLDNGYNRKQAKEAARAVLPNGTETRIVVTGNMRAWRDVIQKRISRHADAEIQEFAKRVLTQLKEIAPHTFQDIEVPE